MDNEKWEYIEGTISIICDLNPLAPEDITLPSDIGDPNRWKESIIQRHNADRGKEVDGPTEVVRESNLK